MTLDAAALARRRLARGALALASGALTLFLTQSLAAPLADARPADGRNERTVTEWLARMQDASRRRSYIGTFVVTSSNGSMASARIWHACDGQRQVERIDTLSGEKRSTFRRDDEVLTFLPETRTVRSERRESLGLLPELVRPDDSAIPNF